MESNLDKYYTKAECVEYIVNITLKIFPDSDLFVEPSAGSGNISNYLKSLNKKVLAYDISPEDSSIIQADYLKQRITKKSHITIGNPPFGYKGDLAIKFLNKALLESRAVAFIMPITLTRYSCQNKINSKAKLIHQEILNKNSFELPNKKEYECASVFQIWTLNKYNINLRTKKPQIEHKDFKLYRHNATKESRKYLDYDWDFAIYAQGRKDYKKIFLRSEYESIKEKIESSSDQFYFFKASSDEVLKRLLNIDYESLAYDNHITPGFCKNDIIGHYKTKYDKKEEICLM